VIFCNVKTTVTFWRLRYQNSSVYYCCMLLKGLWDT